jgi:SAM-dependent methyltransferase
MEPGLDSAFLRYIGVTSESQIPIRRFYLPLFDGCKRVADLGCGGGDFVQLLNESGAEAFGVDSDPKQCDSLRERGIPVVEQDVLEFLRAAKERSLDGIYSAHLVEHLPYASVLELIRLSYRALSPGGRLILATPNPRSPMSHLELFHLHFGHEAFYHPRLLMFFMDYCGFENLEEGENPHTPSLIWDSSSGSASALSDLLPLAELDGFHMATISPQWDASVVDKKPLWRCVRRVRNIVGRLFVWPLAGDILSQLNQILYRRYVALNHVDQALQRIDKVLEAIKALDRPFECYVVGHKPASETSSK